MSKVQDETEFSKALELAFSYSDKVLIEECIRGRELEISVLGNEDIEVSLPGEVKTKTGVYSYQSKYVDPHATELIIPVHLEQDKLDQMQEYARTIYRILSCRGMARVDFFLKEDGTFIFNEINTIPGFTNISMYSKLWEVSGLSYPELLDKLVQLAKYS